MTKQITLEELLKLVTVSQSSDGSWHIDDVHGDVRGTVYGNVDGSVFGKIKGREWTFVLTNTDKLELIFDGVIEELRPQRQESN